MSNKIVIVSDRYVPQNPHIESLLRAAGCTPVEVISPETHRLRMLTYPEYRAQVEQQAVRQG